MLNEKMDAWNTVVSNPSELPAESENVVQVGLILNIIQSSTALFEQSDWIYSAIRVDFPL